MKKLIIKLLSFVFPYFFYRAYKPQADKPSVFTDIVFTKKADLNYIHSFLSLIRFDRPVGTVLLLLPCYFGVAIASKIGGYEIDFNIIIMLFLGAFLMRSAGCIINDIVDIDIDARVERTKFRPLASKAISKKSAFIILLVFLLLAFLVLMYFNNFTIIVALSSFGLVVFYPFVKRFSNFPQLILGFAFNWGILVGYSALANSLDYVLLIIFFGSIFWTIGYDTIYAYMDIKDDIKSGVGSTAILTISNVALYISLFYLIFFISIILSLLYIKASALSYLISCLIALHLFWQAYNVSVEDRELCLFAFKSNMGVGFLTMLAFILA